MESQSSWIIIRRLRWPFLVIILTFSISILGMVLIPGQDDQGNVYHLNFFDAFYFVSYMASTIGFGESPYAFTYEQKLWVSFCIYLTVIGWFYGIGAIVALVQDEVLHKELSRNTFKRALSHLNEPFILILGYNNITKELIEKLNRAGMRMVVVDKDQQAIDELVLENYQPAIPAYCGDVFNTKMLELAGVRKKNCHWVVALFDDDQKNTKLAVMCKYLNKHAELIVRSNSIQNNSFLEKIGIEHVINPFEIISQRLSLSLTAPHLWLLKMWIYGHILKIKKREVLPEGKYIIYGNGRMAKALKSGLEKAGVDYVFIDARESQTNMFALEHSELCKEDEIEEKLMQAGIEDAAVIIAGTRDDLINLAVIALAKKHNPDIYAISRENEIEDMHMFQAARVQRHYVLEQIMTDETYNYLAMPLAHKFVEMLYDQDEAWGKTLVEYIYEKLGERPLLHEVTIDDKEAYAVYHQLKEGQTITLGMLRRKRENYREESAIIFLMLMREEETPVLLPSDETPLHIGDRLLVVSLPESRVDLEYILENYYELYYVMHGKEQSPGIFSLLS